MRIGMVLRAAVVLLAAAVGLGLATAPASAGELDRYLDLPLVNRNAEAGPGGVHPDLPYDAAQLRGLLDQARAEGVAPTRYAALLYQYWLVDATNKAGIDLRTWDPRAGVEANRQNLIRSYRYYEDLQLAHRELQWAGMGGQVGADFGGGLIDFELMSNIYSLPGLSESARGVIAAVEQAAGPQAVAMLPRGLAALAEAGPLITPEDLHYIIGMILVMQKNIFSDLMPMHDAYVTGGLPALEEFQAAGLFGADIMNAWRGIASGDHDRIADGNATLLRREQEWAIGAQWDKVRAYKGAVGEAITYVSGAAGSPSVAGVAPPREFNPVRIPFTMADGRPALLTMPLPDWNWSVLDARWDYITSELLPKYKWQVENNWPALEAVMRTPYEIQMESHRPLLNIPQLLDSAVRQMKVTPVGAEMAVN
ncbi:hypothetical protein GV791_27725 [Nocardia cyriacigeorgica]|uniref:Tat pathway signal protein n=1 Tax=Nocardia cyriacigeorgica TaxID=135487 RepID=A0A6P1CX32_9NOCA|nr:hypothetical protein [Nocardia cyriacigeorgica]NEW36322.1 hypothetical protein [Nocardia cyriacigeorgica]BDU09161.1 hypothetical protein FMUBM48_54240 [Nocardia cyriacigeorgica]